MKQILLVDDDAKLLEALVRQFHSHRQEWRVATARNGAAPDKDQEECR